MCCIVPRLLAIVWYYTSKELWDITVITILYCFIYEWTLSLYNSNILNVGQHLNMFFLKTYILWLNHIKYEVIQQKGISMHLLLLYCKWSLEVSIELPFYDDGWNLYYIFWVFLYARSLTEYLITKRILLTIKKSLILSYIMKEFQ